MVVLRAAEQRVRHTAWRIGLASVTGALAWWLAQRILEQPAPIFAPIAAIVSLIDEPGVRGRRVFRLIGGVLVGVVVGEVLVRYLDTGPWQIVAAMAISMLLVSAFSTNPLTLIQAGIAAMLVIALHAPDLGFDRLYSALLGGLLALVVSQVLVTPNPSALLADAARDALTPATRGLRGAAHALHQADPEAAADVLDLVRKGHQELATFETARERSRAITQQTVRGHRQRNRVRQLDARLVNIERVHTDTVLIARALHAAMPQSAQAPAPLIQALDDLAAAADTFATDPLDDQRRQHAHALALPVGDLQLPALPESLATLAGEVRTAAGDLTELTRPPS
ncbi:uncharacterized membrane protein YgaE (UPF0421/DUF939 family) [Halopolyspora algeriensis]|uniref:Uncharacterized membrane protein YgaE (UPF0421/DUF939 family) n=1 Tax=Halopolyspora algeriensis TaxID=1500506 RepID=A0A368W2D3_9ACTN|nr:FUSC family protein [Halopolyspora algeriensis]RCW46138.1 uncharacterized membrane protein YgaE (UPF0421/DUF939 family) [Halopolyspora algeriensis]TQM55541.1 uncharacterized membrane protein YgaE (UPF0421/DUF939 family) [Halopolyspora algeriensis]